LFICFFVYFHRKKKKSKHKKRDLEEAIANIDEVEAGPSGGSQAKVIPSDDSKVYYGGKTNAEIAFLKKKEERVRFKNFKVFTS
jgi:preprotein translocase subunit YajC